MPPDSDLKGIDIPTMSRMSNDDYRNYICGEGGFFVDHHDVLRDWITGRPLATTLEQLEILLESVFKLSLSRKKFEHSANAGDVNHGFAGRRTAFIIASEPPGAGEPGESAFDHPTPG